MASIATRLQRFKDNPSLLIDPAVVERACLDAGHQWRERQLSPYRTLCAFAQQIANGNAAISHVVRLAGNDFNESAYCQARSRLPLSVVRAVLEDFAARDGGAAANKGARLWCGHRVALIDGTGVSVPDTPVLRAAFGVPSKSPDGCGLPMVKALMMFDAATGSLLGMNAASCTTGDGKHAPDLHPGLCPGDVLVGDRGLCGYVHLAMLLQIECHGVFRVSSSRTLPFPARSGERRRRSYNRHRHSEPLLVEMISSDDQIIEIVKPHNRPKHLSPECFAKIPGKIVVRAVRYRTGGPGTRPREIVLLTTLLDPDRYPASALADLYKMRWQVEQNIRHLKRTLGMDRLKCESVEGVARELMMFALIHNAVCRVRAATALRMGIDARRLSYVDTLRGILRTDPGPAPGFRLPVVVAIKVWPLRVPRVEPRRLKRLHSTFRVMTRPRARSRWHIMHPTVAVI